jgi:hypothetical protein
MREAERVVITVSGDQRCVEREKLLDRKKRSPASSPCFDPLTVIDP